MAENSDYADRDPRLFFNIFVVCKGLRNSKVIKFFKDRIKLTTVIILDDDNSWFRDPPLEKIDFFQNPCTEIS